LQPIWFRKEKPPPYFKEIGDVLGYKANVNPEFTLSSDGDKKRKNVETETINSAKKTKIQMKKNVILDALNQLRKDRREFEEKLEKQHQEKMGLLERLVSAFEKK